MFVCLSVCITFLFVSSMPRFTYFRFHLIILIFSAYFNIFWFLHIFCLAVDLKNWFGLKPFFSIFYLFSTFSRQKRLSPFIFKLPKIILNLSPNGFDSSVPLGLYYFKLHPSLPFSLFSVLILLYFNSFFLSCDPI